jgi:hypothetical protein
VEVLSPQKSHLALERRMQDGRLSSQRTAAAERLIVRMGKDG